MSNNDTASFDEFSVGGQDWFYDELQNGNNAGGFDFNTSLNLPLDNGPSTPPPTTSSSVHHNQSTQQHSTAYRNNVGHIDEIQPSTSNYGIQQQSQVQNVDQQQINVNQQMRQHHQMQSQSQEFETLRPFNHGQQQAMNQSIQNQYQDNQQIDMVYDNTLDFDMYNGPTTSAAMPMNCGINQEYQSQQSQYQSQQDWVINQPPQSQSMSVVYTSSTQSVPKIPDPGGHSNQQQHNINYNTHQQPQQIIHTGHNGEILTNMQPMHVQNQQQYDMNSSYNVYVDQNTGTPRYISQDQFNNSYQQVQVVNQQANIQQIQPEPVKPAPKTKPRKTATKKKNQNISITARIEAMMAGMHKLELKLEGDQSLRFGQLLASASSLIEKEQQGIDVSAEFKRYEDEILLIMNGGQRIEEQPKPESVQIQQQYIQQQQIIYPQPSNQPTPSTRKKKTKAEIQQEKRANTAAQPLPLQTPIAANDSRIVAQDSNSITVNYEGKMMRAVMVCMEDGTATYQILGEVGQTSNMPPRVMNTPIRPQQEQNTIMQQVSARAGPEETKNMVNIVSSVIDNCETKPKITKKATPARGKANKKVQDTPKPPDNRNILIESKPIIQQIPRTEPLCVPSTSYQTRKIILPAVSQLSKFVKDKREIRKKKVSEFLMKMRENMECVNVHTPFTEKQDVLQRLLPYGFHYEPNLSKHGMGIYDNELERHRVHNDLQCNSIYKRLENIFINESKQQQSDSELNMLLAIDMNYERKLLEDDKLKAEANLDRFIRESDVLNSKITKEEIDIAQQNLSINRPRHRSYGKNFVYEYNKFDEETYRQRKQDLLDEIERKRREKERARDEDSSSDESIPSPIITTQPPLNFNNQLKQNNKNKMERQLILSSSDSEFDDGSYTMRHKMGNLNNHKQSRTPSPQKKRISPTRKSPKKTESYKKSLSPVKQQEKIKEKEPEKIKHTSKPPSLPPGYSSIQLDIGSFKIPKIGDKAKGDENSANSSKLLKPSEKQEKQIVSNEFKNREQHKDRVVPQSSSSPFKLDIKPPQKQINNQQITSNITKEVERNQLKISNKKDPSEAQVATEKIGLLKLKNVFKEEHPYANVMKESKSESSKKHGKDKKKKDKEKDRIDSRENHHKGLETPKQEPNLGLTLKINVGKKKVDDSVPSMTDEERKKEKKKKKKEKKERERREREEKERQELEEKERLEQEEKRKKEEKEAKKQKKLEKEKRKAEKKERKQLEKLRKETSSQLSSTSFTYSDPATPDIKPEKKLLIRFKNPTTSTVEDIPPPPVLVPEIPPPKITVKIPKLEKEREIKKEPKPEDNKIDDHHHKHRSEKKEEKHKKNSEHRHHKKEKKKHKRGMEILDNDASTPPPKFPKITIKLGQKSTPDASITPSQASDYYSMPNKDPLTPKIHHSVPMEDVMQYSVLNNDLEGPVSMFGLDSHERSQSPLSIETRNPDLKAITSNILLRIRDR